MVAIRRGSLRGHMVRGIRSLRERLRLCDIAVEVLDARAPLSSRNPRLDEHLQQKPRLIVLTRADLADTKVTQRWQNYFEKLGTPAYPVDARSGKGAAAILQAARRLRSHRPGGAGRGARRNLRLMVVGIPNVGKSSLINRWSGGRKAAVGAKAGITRGPQWIRLEGIELLDLPGILTPTIEDDEHAWRLAAIGAAGVELVSHLAAAYGILHWLTAEYPGTIEKMYGIDIDDDIFASGASHDVATDDASPAFNMDLLIQRLGERLGSLQAGGEVDEERVATRVVRDFQEGRFGRVSLESPPQSDLPTEKDTADG